MKTLKNNVDYEVTFTDLEAAKKYYIPNLEEDSDPEWKEYVVEIEESKTLEELAEVLNKYTDLFGNGIEYLVKEVQEEENTMKEILGYDLNKFEKLTVTDGENTIKGVVFGDDECFDCDRYYNFILSGEKLYKAYYESEGIELDNIDYEKAVEIVDVTEEYEDFIKDYLDK